MRKVLTAHGIFTSGTNSIDKLDPLLRSRQCEVVSYEYFPNDLIAARLLNWKRENAVRDLAKQQGITVGIGHSNGCAILHGAARKGAGFKLLIYANPALDSKPKPLPKEVERVYVLHAPDDMATWVAKFLILSPWGDAGRNGYKGDDSRFINLNMGTGLVWSPYRRAHEFRDTPVWDVQSPGPEDEAHGHSGVWSERYWLELIADLGAGRLIIG